jgi:hypothetical protein
MGSIGEKVVATILMPKSHRGIFLPARKKDFLSEAEFLDAHKPTNNERTKYPIIIDQSKRDKVMVSCSIV